MGSAIVERLSPSFLAIITLFIKINILSYLIQFFGKFFIIPFNRQRRQFCLFCS